MSMTSEGLRPARRSAMTAHGAALDGVPLNKRLRMTPVPMREDIARRAEKVRGYCDADVGPVDLLVKTMGKLSLETARFGGFGESGDRLDALVKAEVSNHHRSWIMAPLERLYDALVAAEAGKKGGRE